MLAVGCVGNTRRTGAELRRTWAELRRTWAELRRTWVEFRCAWTELWPAGAHPRRRQQRQIIPPIHPKHAHATPPHRDGTVDDVRHGDHPAVADREAGGDLVARGNTQRSHRRRDRGARRVIAE
jgi:hypothetical protein